MWRFSDVQISGRRNESEFQGQKRKDGGIRLWTCVGQEERASTV